MPVKDGIVMPRDQYMHVGAPSEWWWHIGTLTAPGGRTFGFEINAATQSPGGQLMSFSQIMLTDIVDQVHFQATTQFPYDPAWAESDSTKPWYARLGTAGESGSIAMTAPAANPCDMTVDASFIDAATGVSIAFALTLSQDSVKVPPLLVWGDGVYQSVASSPDPLQTSNFYYSLTKLQASGTITIGEESFEVQGTTWMDHEYGMFGVKTKWILQDAQLDNGIDLSNSCVGQQPVAGQPMVSIVTVRWPEGNSTSHYSELIPSGPTWTSPDGQTYCLTMAVTIPDLKTELTFVSAFPDQEFPVAGNPVYEGIATVTGNFMGDAVQGPGWIEQALLPR
ncbi:lipocalin-like domain-containing protein [Sphingomonas sp.]|jgi:predicted secreted hydrolase|uniref:lipocalin-like domain-containing protein n=1 Tax=Sphingomonas sp. TaxID=28214 RepID=UPI002E35F0BA|nr:lipocalin-like domain-containing protein [Sphingomonas sp.]HEX4694797.1 lipocalin-like domain-containing protein [Sphingomonas sp.]